MAKKNRNKWVTNNDNSKETKKKVSQKNPKSNIITLSASIISDKKFIESYSDMCGYSNLSNKSGFIEMDIHKTGHRILDKVDIKINDEVSKFITSVLYDLPVEYDQYPSVFDILKQMVMDDMVDNSYLHINTKTANTPVGFEVISHDNPEFKMDETYQMIKNNDDIISAISRYDKFMNAFSIVSKEPTEFINRLLNTDIDFINRRKQMQKLLSISDVNIAGYICDVRNEFDRLSSKEKDYIKKFYRGEINVDQLYLTIKPLVVKYDNVNILDIIVQAACWYLVTNVFSGDCVITRYIHSLVTYGQISQNQDEAILNHLREAYKSVGNKVMYYNEFSCKTLYELLNENTRFKSGIYDAEYGFTSGKMSGYDIQRFIGNQMFFGSDDVVTAIIFELGQKGYEICELVDDNDLLIPIPKCLSTIDFISGEININGFCHDIMDYSFTNGASYVHLMLDDIKKYLVYNLFEGDDLIHLDSIRNCIDQYRIKEMDDNLYKDEKPLRDYIVPIKVFCKEDVEQTCPLIAEIKTSAKDYNDVREVASINLKGYFKDGATIDVGIARLVN